MDDKVFYLIRDTLQEISKSQSELREEQREVRIEQREIRRDNSELAVAVKRLETKVDSLIEAEPAKQNRLSTLERSEHTNKLKWVAMITASLTGGAAGKPVMDTLWGVVKGWFSA